MVQMNYPAISVVHMPPAGRHQAHDVENHILEFVSKRCTCPMVNEHEWVVEFTYIS